VPEFSSAGAGAQCVSDCLLVGPGIETVIVFMPPLFVSRGSLRARISASTAYETPQPASEIVSIWFGCAEEGQSALVAEPDLGEMDDSKGCRSRQRGHDSC
jgi:hypothetical protein